MAIQAPRQLPTPPPATRAERSARAPTLLLAVGTNCEQIPPFPPSRGVVGADVLAAGLIVIGIGDARMSREYRRPLHPQL